MSAFRVAFITVPGDKAEELSRSLVENKLAACVNMIDKVKSVYHQRGAVDTATETLLIAKTASMKIEKLIKYVRENHPYDTPEVIAVDITEGNPDYLNWIHEGM
jgi:periplasmic divalent cation tolerance protein